MECYLLMLSFMNATGKKISLAITFLVYLGPLLVIFSNQKKNLFNFKEDDLLFVLGSRQLFLFRNRGVLGKKAEIFQRLRELFRKNCWDHWETRPGEYEGKFPQMKIAEENFQCSERRTDFICSEDIAGKTGVFWGGQVKVQDEWNWNVDIWWCLVKNHCVCNLGTKYY